jgi:signal transduction histidine kinase
MNKPALHRRIIMWIVECWRLVMDNRYNLLKYIPDPSLQAYFTLVLFTMWSVYFGFVATYYMGWLGYNTITSIIVHFAVLLPVLFTNAVFKDAERDNAPWLYKWREEQKSWKFWQNKPKPNMVKWDIDKEA